MATTAFVALADGFEEIEAAAPIDILRRAGLDVTVVALAGRGAKGAHGVAFEADAAWEEVAGRTPDVLVLPGGMPGAERLGAHAGLRALAERVAAADGTLAAICAAPACTLAAWGLLDGRRATCYPGFERRFPASAAYVDEPVVTDGRLVTARGPGAALAFALAVVAGLRGEAARDELAAQMQGPA